MHSRCPHCGQALPPRNPLPTVDVVIYVPGRGVVLVERRFEPLGWALPGGIVEVGETLEQAAVREAREETGLAVVLTGVLGVYSDPARDPRRHTLSVVYTAQAEDMGTLRAGDDAGNVGVFALDALPGPIAFDHRRILGDFARVLARLNRTAGA